MKAIILLAVVVATVALSAPQFEYVMAWKIAGVINYSQPMSLERCDKLVKEQPHLRAVCVPVLK